MTSKAATLPVELSPVSKKRTASGPRRIVSSDGLTRRPVVCVIVIPLVNYVYHVMIVNRVYRAVNAFTTKHFAVQDAGDADRRAAARSRSGHPAPYHQGAQCKGF